MISSSDAEVKDGEEITKGWDKYSKPHSVAYFIVVCFLGAITGAVTTALGTDLLGLYIVLDRGFIFSFWQNTLGRPIYQCPFGNFYRLFYLEIGASNNKLASGGVDQRSHYCPLSDLKPLFYDHHERKLYCFLYSYFSLLLFSVVKKRPINADVWSGNSSFTGKRSAWRYGFYRNCLCFFFSFLSSKEKRCGAISLNCSIAVLLVVSHLVTFGDLVTNKLPQDMSMLFSEDFLGEWTQIAARDWAAYLTGSAPTSPLSMFLQTPLRILYFLYTPFVWMVSAAVDVVGFFDALLDIFLSIYAFKGLASLQRKDKLLFWGIVLILVVFLVVFAWGISNYGTAIRHRQKIVWFLSVPAAIEIAKSRALRRIYPVKRLYRGKI